MIVSVKIYYNGKYMAKAGVQSEEIKVDCNINHAYKAIMEYLQQEYGIEPPFLLMVRGMHVMGAIKKEIQLCEGDAFHVLPFLSGG